MKQNSNNDATIRIDKLDIYSALSFILAIIALSSSVL